MRSCKYTWARILNALKKHEFAVFEQEYDLNLVGIRTSGSQENTFDDWLCVAHKRGNGTWASYFFQCTTDPGTYYRENSISSDGTAIVVSGRQYRGVWELGKHRGKYDALVQRAPISVHRDDDGNAILDQDSPIVDGMFGINLHRANSERASMNVDRWSAGCQVLADPDDFEFLLTICRRQIDVRGYKTFSYSLIESRDIS